MNKPATEARCVVVEREIPHPPEKIWRALTQAHLIEEWLMNNDFRPEVGRRFNLRGEWGGVLDCEVLAVEPLKTLSYTWDFAHDDAAFNLKSVVTFTLTPTPRRDAPAHGAGGFWAGAEAGFWRREGGVGEVLRQAGGGGGAGGVRAAGLNSKRGRAAPGAEEPPEWRQTRMCAASAGGSFRSCGRAGRRRAKRHRAGPQLLATRARSADFKPPSGVPFRYRIRTSVAELLAQAAIRPFVER